MIHPVVASLPLQWQGWHRRASRRTDRGRGADARPWPTARVNGQKQQHQLHQWQWQKLRPSIMMCSIFADSFSGTTELFGNSMNMSTDSFLFKNNNNFCKNIKPNITGRSFGV
ncbi:hypothetical protein JTB14_027651 [Gonioctena quinquepunctata]|nr:hypothetical protein JTB14_027651 [Gonioctena quinquepunctata]